MGYDVFKPRPGKIDLGLALKYCNGGILRGAKVLKLTQFYCILCRISQIYGGLL